MVHVKTEIFVNVQPLDSVAIAACTINALVLGHSIAIFFCKFIIFFRNFFLQIYLFFGLKLNNIIRTDCDLLECSGPLNMVKYSKYILRPHPIVFTHKYCISRALK